jgi:two-component system sensor histidine kinase PilS (NtrC family)
MDEIKVRLKWLMAFRVVAATLLLGLAIGIQAYKREAVDPVYQVLLVVTFALTIAYALLLRTFATPQALIRFAHGQLGGDLLLETILVARTTGIDSPFSVLYVITATFASLLMRRRDGLLTAGIAVILFGCVTLLQTYRPEAWAGWFQSSTLASPEILQAFVIHALAILIVGYLSGTLAEQRHRADQSLIEKERELSNLEELNENIVSSIPSGVFTTNLKGQITFLNQAARDIMGYAAGQGLYQPWWEVFHWESQDLFSEATVLPGMSAKLEVKPKRADGTQLVLGMTLSPLTQGGVQIGLVGVFKDLTKERELEDEMRRREWFAKIGEMSAGMAHEIRNPLGGMAGALQMLRNDQSLDGESARLMDIAIGEATRLNTIVTEFLRYSRPPDLNLKECDLRVLLEETIALIKHDDGSPSSPAIALDHDPGLALIQVDPDKMKQVFWNLATNAVQAMPSGGRLTISTARRRVTSGGRSGEIVEIAFQDTGSGINRDDLKKIFFPFFTTKKEGSGLGLATAQRIVDQHGGWIRVESREGQGSRFTVCLPATGGAGPRLWHEGREPWKKF